MRYKSPPWENYHHQEDIISMNLCSCPDSFCLFWGEGEGKEDMEAMVPLELEGQVGKGVDSACGG